ncbi:glycosyltransferase [Arcticibacter eurypsychrophilus]|uniref:glycosyltransferase n=1 Tax=Arcticibacter eurypsychrophilus TaxID=1434752 RepID=UPI0009F249E4|nr:glycosyltransferase [Arcticibacter eurypsychrophilus]
MKLITITSRFLPGNLMEYCNERKIEIIILNQDHFSIASKWILIFKLLGDSFKVLSHLKELRRKNTIISVGYITVPLLIYRSLGLIKKRTSIIWEGFFLHNHRYFPAFKKLFRLFFCEDDSLLVYSEFEKNLYSNAFNLKSSNIHFIPLVFEPKPNETLHNQYTKEVDWNNITSDFYFSGGYSHRDYASLIEIFRKESTNLVICSSELNHELRNIKMPDNVILLNDVAREEFAELVRRSKACIVLIKSNSGAAGQLFAIEVMYYSKIIIASSTDILKEMISNRENGFLVTDPILEIPFIIKEIEDELTDFVLLKKKAKDKVTTLNSKINYNHHMNIALERAGEYRRPLELSQ